AGGSFSSAGGVPADAIARWDGTTWFSVSGGFGNENGLQEVYSLLGFQKANERSLIAGGAFTFAGGVPSAYAARLGAGSVRTRWGNVDTGSGGPPADVVTVNGSAGDPVDRVLSIAAGSEARVEIARAPTWGSRGLYALWMLDGDPGSLDCV